MIWTLMSQKKKVLAVDDKNVMISFFVGKERKIGARRDTNSIRWALLKPNTFPFPRYSSQKRSKGIKIYWSQASKYLLKVLLHENPSFKYLSELSNHSILAVKSFRDGCNFCYNLQSRNGGTIKESTMLDLFKRSWRARALLDIGKVQKFVDPHLFFLFEFSSLEVPRGSLSLSGSQWVSASLSNS